MNMTEDINKLDIKKWLERSFSLSGKSIADVKAVLADSIVRNGFKIRKQEGSSGSYKIEAIYGSKSIAILLGLIPFGKHLPSGKRFLMEVSLYQEHDLRIDIRITPYMELFGAEEMAIVTQSLDEKATDEYFAARLLHQVVIAAYNKLNVRLPEDLLVFNTATFARDTFWSILIYPLDSYRAKKPIYVTAAPGAWCWGGFIIPEFWFLWHEIWGVSLLAGIPTALYIRLDDQTVLQYLLLTLIIGIRILLGMKGSKIYFAKYGRWPKK